MEDIEDNNLISKSFLELCSSVGLSNSNTLIWNHDLLSDDFHFVEIISTQVIFVHAHPYLRYALSKHECENKNAELYSRQHIRAFSIERCIFAMQRLCLYSILQLWET